MARFLLPSFNLKKKGKDKDREARQAMPIEVSWTELVAIQPLANSPPCQEETEVLNAPHFLFLHSPYPAKASHPPSVNRSQRTCDAAVTVVRLPGAHSRVKDESRSTGANTCNVKKHSGEYVDMFNFCSLSHAVKEPWKLVFKNWLPDFKEPLQIRVSDYRHIKREKQHQKLVLVLYLENFLGSD